jgi:hypothetical protein
MIDAFTVENLGDSFLINIQQDGISEGMSVSQSDSFKQNTDCFSKHIDTYGDGSNLVCRKKIHNIQF